MGQCVILLPNFNFVILFYFTGKEENDGVENTKTSTPTITVNQIHMMTEKMKIPLGTPPPTLVVPEKPTPHDTEILPETLVKKPTHDNSAILPETAIVTTPMTS